MFVQFTFTVCLVGQSCLTLCNPMDYSLPGSSAHGDSAGKNTGVGCHSLFQGIFPTQGLNQGLPYCRWVLYHLSHEWSILYQYTKNPLLYTCSHQHSILYNSDFNWYIGWKFLSPSFFFVFPWLLVRLVLFMELLAIFTFYFMIACLYLMLIFLSNSALFLLGLW